LLGVCLFPVAASASGRAAAKVQAVTTPSQGVGPKPANYDISCPRGLKAVGGGFSTFGISISGDLVPGGGPVTAVVPVVMESRRLDGHTWRITEKAALNPAAGPVAPGGTTVTASVYCRKVRGRVRAVEGVGDLLTSNSSPSATDPKCPKGQVALAGGFSVSVPESGFVYPSVYESFRDGQRGWKSSAIPNTQQSVGLLGFVYCSHESRPPRTVRRLVGSGITAVTCAKGRAAAAGGFQSAPGSVLGFSMGSNGGKKRSYPPFTAYPAGPSWTFGGPAGTTEFAYCS
jgi:hypothetical protein